MKPRHIIHFAWIGLLAFAFLMGCSIRAIPFDPPLDEEQAVSHERDFADYGSYYSGYGNVPPEFSYNAWQMAQYYRYANEPSYGGYAYEFGYLPPDRLNIDPNPNDSYRADEVPVRRAPSQRSVQAEAYRRSNYSDRGQQNNVSVQRAESRTRYDSSDSSAKFHREKERDVRQQLKQRRSQSDDDSSTTDEEREAQRRKLRQRAQR